MKWALSQLQKYSGRGFEFDEEIDLSSLKDGKHVLDVSAVNVSGVANVEKLKVTFNLTIKATLTLPCSRTLEPVLYPVNIDTTETFFSEEIPEDFDGYLMEKGLIDLVPVVKEILFLEIPMQIYADKYDQTQAGHGWELVTEENESNQKIDPRMAKLAELLKD